MQLDEFEAFDAMRVFLWRYWKRSNSEEVASLLGDVNYSTDPSYTADPAAWNDWMACVQGVLDNGVGNDRAWRDDTGSEP